MPDLAPRVPDGRSPLWRAFNVYRVIALLYAASWFGVEVRAYERPVLGSVLLAITAVWTVFTIWRYRFRGGRTNRLVFLDQVVVSVLFLGGSLVWNHGQPGHSQPSVVSVWESSMPLVAGLQWGMVGGGISGVLAATYLLLARDLAPTSATFTNMMLLVGAGMLVGLASEAVHRSTERLAKALRTESATAERQRLARSIHDNVLQVLARVRRRGNELGGEAAELARLAGEQEIALRTLMVAPVRMTADGEADFAAQLRTLRTTKVEVSVAADSVLLPEAVASDLLAVVREALVNVARHAGPEAKAWVLLENLESEVVLSVRDDGRGIPEGRLAEAAAEGHLGVAQSIRGRIRNLGEPSNWTPRRAREPNGKSASPGSAKPVCRIRDVAAGGIRAGCYNACCNSRSRPFTASEPAPSAIPASSASATSCTRRRSRRGCGVSCRASWSAVPVASRTASSDDRGRPESSRRSKTRNSRRSTRSASAHAA